LSGRKSARPGPREPPRPPLAGPIPGAHPALGRHADERLREEVNEPQVHFIRNRREVNDSRCAPLERHGGRGEALGDMMDDLFTGCALVEVLEGCRVRSRKAEEPQSQEIAEVLPGSAGGDRADPEPPGRGGEPRVSDRPAQALACGHEIPRDVADEQVIGWARGQQGHAKIIPEASRLVPL